MFRAFDDWFGHWHIDAADQTQRRAYTIWRDAEGVMHLAFNEGDVVCSNGHHSIERPRDT